MKLIRSNSINKWCNFFDESEERENRVSRESAFTTSSRKSILFQTLFSFIYPLYNIIIIIFYFSLHDELKSKYYNWT